MTQNLKIHVLHTGLVEVDTALPFHGTSHNPLAFTGLFRGAYHKVILPVSSYLIEHPKGLVLIDTGWHRQIRNGQWAELGLQTQINRGYLPAGWAIDEQLTNLGIEARNLDYLMLSHLHSDHASGLRQLKDAPRILTSAEEWQAANHDRLRYLPRGWAGVNVQTFDYQSAPIGPFHRAFDLFGDGSVLFVAVPGHSAGLSATLIRGADGKYVLLTSDTAYAPLAWQKMLTPGIVVSRANAITSLGWIKQMATAPDCLEAIANHDPAMQPHTITLSL